jgi:AcrR family transcriptional regulator
MSETIAYTSYLAQCQAASPGASKGERTRSKLLLCAAELLNEIGYRDIQIPAICKLAGMATGSFYFHFKNKTEITLAVMADFQAMILQQYDLQPKTGSNFDAVYRANLLWISMARANPGLFRCLVQLSDEFPEFKEVCEQFDREWLQRVARSIGRSAPKGGEADNQVFLLAAYALGGMLDQFCKRLFVDRNQSLAETVSGAVQSDEELAEVLALLWYRSIYCMDPPGLKARASRHLLQIKGGDKAQAA